MYPLHTLPILHDFSENVNNEGAQSRHRQEILQNEQPPQKIKQLFSNPFLPFI